MKPNIERFAEELALVHAIQQHSQSFKEQQNISFLFPVIGKDYLDSDVRLMIVGRATNGWVINKLSDIDVGTFNPEISFDDWKNIKGYSNLQKNVMNRSPFWRIAKQVFAALSSEPTQNAWYERIIWANLCMAGPVKYGNPSAKLCSFQLSHCRIILKKYIDLYKPTHILFITGDYGWFDWFNNKDEPNVLSFIPTDTNTDSRYLCKTGKIGNSNVIVANRPDNRKKGSSEKDYIASVVKAFSKF